MSNKKITFFISSLNGGGAEGVCINLANALSKRGWNITIVILNLNNAEYKNRIEDSVELISLNVSNSRYAFFKMRKLLVDNNIQKVVAFDYIMTILLVLIRVTLKSKFYIIMRNINTLSQKKNMKKTFKQKIVYSLLNKIFYKVDYIVNQCNAMKKDLLSLHSLNPKNVGVIYNPVNKKIEDVSTNSSDIKKEDFFLCVGRLEKQKSFEYAIKAFANISTSYPNFRLKIVGKGSLETYLKKIAIECGIESKIDFEGFQQDVIPYYQKAKATILTSVYEGFPNVLIESITLGTPVISFDCPSGPNEIIEEGLNGYLVEYQNINDLSSKMLKVIENKFDSKVVISTSKKYSTENIITKWENLLIQ